MLLYYSGTGACSKAKLYHIFVLLYVSQPLRAYRLRLVGDVEGKEKR